CLPLFLPVILGLQRRVGLRNHDGPPRLWEVLQHWGIFSILVEVILPRFPQYFRTTGDAWDTVAYLLGGLAAWMWWSGETDRSIRLSFRIARSRLACHESFVDWFGRARACDGLEVGRVAAGDGVVCCAGERDDQTGGLECGD